MLQQLLLKIVFRVHVIRYIFSRAIYFIDALSSHNFVNSLLVKISKLISRISNFAFDFTKLDDISDARKRNERFNDIRRDQKLSIVIIILRRKRNEFHDIILRLERKRDVKRLTFERIHLINIETSFEFIERFFDILNNFEHLIHVKYKNQNVVISLD